jgi:hypothetical protein
VTADPRRAHRFRFVRATYEAARGVAELVYAFDDGPELIERISFPEAPPLAPEREAAFARALQLLHLIAGVSYYKAGVPREIAIDSGPLDRATAELMETIYLHGLGEFAYSNGLDLRGHIRFPRSGASADAIAPALGLQRRTLVPIGGGKDSLVTVELLRAAREPITCAWVGRSELIEGCVAATGLPRLNIGRELSPLLFELNRAGAYNGHIPVTAINSAIVVLAALLYGYDEIAFSNERSASSATLRADGIDVNHQWSKGFAFETIFGDYVAAQIAADLNYYSLLRPLSELAVTRQFARLSRYHPLFSSCNRNFRILAARPEARWCGECPKCHFVFLALAPFLPKPALTRIFGRNLLDESAHIPAFDALMEWNAHKPFECVGEGFEARAAMAALAERAEWREDAVVARFRAEILPRLETAELALEKWLAPGAEQRVPTRLRDVLDVLPR